MRLPLSRPCPTPPPLGAGRRRGAPVLDRRPGIHRSHRRHHLRATVIRIFTPEGTLLVEVDDPGVKVTVEGDGGIVITGAGLQEVRLKPGSYKVHAAKDGKPVRLDQELVTITRGDKQVVRVSLAIGLAKAAPQEQPQVSDEIRRFEGHTRSSGPLLTPPTAATPSPEVRIRRYGCGKSERGRSCTASRDRSEG